MGGVLRRAGGVAGLLGGSGACALVYQIVWMRELRLIFGGSTAATAAVLAIFIAGLGLGGMFWGPRADRNPRPLAFYAHLELGIAGFSAASPLLLYLARALYVALGGSMGMGTALATIVRMVLAVLVLAVPTFLMGGTLPAAARAVETDEDRRRHGVALLYGVNTLGAVAGCVLATFFLLEVLGTRMTLWLACAVNLGVGLLARRVARSVARPEPATVDDGGTAARDRAAPTRFVLASAAVVGFAFFLMELVWYRMLGPLLGGTVFTFGLILAVALLGMGLGGAAYALRRSDRSPTVASFAYTCLLEAVFIALPFAIGDDIPVLAILLRGLGVTGFGGMVAGWTVITVIVVWPAAIVSGYQFPLLIALLGSGRTDVGRQVGATYAWNTGGAILGSLAGGFGLIPALTAVGCWRLVAALLGVLGLGALALSVQRERAWRRLAAPAGAALVVVLLLGARGPTDAWRHTPIGAGRAEGFDDSNDIRDWKHRQRRAIIWEADGVESSVGIDASSEISFLQNGKSDGSAKSDSGTQVMAGLLGALFHPHPTRAMVIGLGTGSTAGWLGAIAETERVDVVELEPSILEVARLTTPVNHDVLGNPKVAIHIGDAREVLLTTDDSYDLIASEPSNPYRAGIASLFTREFYRAVRGRLQPGGMFVQWLQAYEIDARTLRTAVATLTSVFPHVEAYLSQRSDILLIATLEPLDYSADRLRARVAGEPWRSALPRVWRSRGLEAVLARRLAGDVTLRDLAGRENGKVNTDDNNRVEFGFAKSVGGMGIDPAELVKMARLRNDQRPRVTGNVDWKAVERQQMTLAASESTVLLAPQDEWTSEQHQISQLYSAFGNGDSGGALALWRDLDLLPVSLLDVGMLAMANADAGDDAALPYIEQLRAEAPTEAMIATAVLRVRQGKHEEALGLVEQALVALRNDPWPSESMLGQLLGLVDELAAQPGAAERLFAALAEPFAVMRGQASRLAARVELLDHLDLATHCLEAISAFEPDVPWNERFLGQRVSCYAALRHPALERARLELEELTSSKRPRLSD